MPFYDQMREVGPGDGVVSKNMLSLTFFVKPVLSMAVRGATLLMDGVEITEDPTCCFSFTTQMTINSRPHSKIDLLEFPQKMASNAFLLEREIPFFGNWSQ